MIALILAAAIHAAPAQHSAVQPLVTLLRDAQGCPAGQNRAYFVASANRFMALCWRPRGALVELLDGEHLVTAMPARWFESTNPPAAAGQGVSQ